MSSGITATSGMQATDFTAHAASRSQAQAPSPDSPQTVTAAAAQLTPNPSLRIDSALAMVVIEFHGTNGAIENSIPTVQQLDAYRRSQGTHHAPEPTASAAGDQPATPSSPTLTSPIVA
jgi:hypothetical protein